MHKTVTINKCIICTNTSVCRYHALFPLDHDSNRTYKHEQHEQFGIYKEDTQISPCVDKNDALAAATCKLKTKIPQPTGLKNPASDVVCYWPHNEIRYQADTTSRHFSL